MKKKVIVGMSGGVDSSISAWLLKKQGYEVLGLFMKNWEADNDFEYCSSRKDWIDAVSVADLIGMDIEVVNFSVEYKDRVFREFLQEYKIGRTPNPDVLCNSEIKFKVFLDHALHLGADFIATGHYARIRKNKNGTFELLRAVDLNKDQSYFLYRLNQAQLSKILFPLGVFYKTKVRNIAHKLQLPIANKKDSTGICFINPGCFRVFLKRYLSYTPGVIKTPEDNLVGQHLGLYFYTLGQRKGIGLGGIKVYHVAGGKNFAWYVARKDMLKNILYVVPGRNHPWLFSSTLDATQVNWIAGECPLFDTQNLSSQIRYRQKDVPCVFKKNTNQSFTLCFDQPQWAITPGQSVVLYQDNICLGGGVIQ